jgi:hypothetical protein
MASVGDVRLRPRARYPPQGDKVEILAIKQRLRR